MKFVSITLISKPANVLLMAINLVPDIYFYIYCSRILTNSVMCFDVSALSLMGFVLRSLSLDWSLSFRSVVLCQPKLDELMEEGHV